MNNFPEARHRARQLLRMVKAWGPPVDVDAIAESLGFTILEYPFPDTTSGLTFIEEGVRAIGVNSRHSRTRRRFSVAHELGHYLCQHMSFDPDGLHVEDRAGDAVLDLQQEREANEFGAELLMPEEWLRQDVVEIGQNAPALARRYQVSEQAMLIQLLDLALL